MTLWLIKQQLVHNRHYDLLICKKKKKTLTTDTSRMKLYQPVSNWYQSSSVRKSLHVSTRARLVWVVKALPRISQSLLSPDTTLVHGHLKDEALRGFVSISARVVFSIKAKTLHTDNQLRSCPISAAKLKRARWWTNQEWNHVCHFQFSGLLLLLGAFFYNSWSNSTVFHRPLSQPLELLLAARLNVVGKCWFVDRVMLSVY